MRKFFTMLILFVLMIFSPIVVMIGYGQSEDAGFSCLVGAGIAWIIFFCWVIGSWAIWHFAPLIHARQKMYDELRKEYEADKADGRVGKYNRRK